MTPDQGLDKIKPQLKPRGGFGLTLVAAELFQAWATQRLRSQHRCKEIDGTPLPTFSNTSAEGAFLVTIEDTEVKRAQPLAAKAPAKKDRR